MKDEFTENLYKEFSCHEESPVNNNIIKADKLKIAGKMKITVEDELDSDIKVVIEKNENDEIREIKFYCSCGQTKSILLDYSD